MRAAALGIAFATLAAPAWSADADVMIVASGRDERIVYRVDTRAATAVHASTHGLAPDGSRPWSNAAIQTARRGRMDPLPFANAREFHARAGQHWRYASPDGTRVVVGHGHGDDNAAIARAELLDVATGARIARIDFGGKRFVHDMLWLPDSSAIALLENDAYSVNLVDLVTSVLGHGSWASDVYVHVVDARSGRVVRVPVAVGLRKPSIVLARPDDVIP